MADPVPTGYYIATVWTAVPDDAWHTTRLVVRLPACGPDDYQARVRELWPAKAAFMTFGPVGWSKVQRDVPRDTR